MLLTDGSIHLFTQSVSEQYNAFLPNLYHCESLSSLSLSLSLATDLGEHVVDHTLRTLYKPLT